MPGGLHDSSLTRVAPVFDQLSRNAGEWPRQLLNLAELGAPGEAVLPSELNLSFIRGYWGEEERGLDPPLSLLSWLIRHPEAWASEPDSDERRLLKAGDPATVERALRGLQTGRPDRAWFILEGRTFPDALVETPDALIVIEGKRTEATPTTHTKWMAGRLQIWRHIDAAWEIRGRRRVFGIFIVQAEHGETPAVWADAARDTLTDHSLRASFPHRSADEVGELKLCFRGVTTWSQVCREFRIDESMLPDTTGASGT